MIAAAVVLLGIHLCGLLGDLKPVIFASGLPLAFYVPGGLLIWAASPGPFVRVAGRVERMGLSVVLSVATVAVMALLLDVTPVGITAVSLTAAIGGLVPIAMVVRWAMEKSSTR